MLEADVALVTDASVDADGEDDEADDGDDLDAGEPHLELSEPADGEVVGGSEDDPEDGDPDTDADLCGAGPVLDDEPSSSELQSESQTPAEEVDPAHGEANGRVNESRSVDGESSSDGDVSCHLTKSSHDREDD